MLKKKQMALLVPAVFIAVATVYFAAQPRLPVAVRFDLEKTQVRGDSMEPVLKNGQTVGIDNDFFQNKSIERGDIVTVQFSWREEPLVKFIRAVPSDTISIEEQ